MAAPKRSAGRASQTGSRKTTKRSAAPAAGGNQAAGGKQRLQRVLAAAGLGSRRQCEAYITEGRVEIDGEIVDRLGSTVDPQQSKIFVDGSRVSMPKMVYFVLHKPTGVVTTNRDPMGRPRVIDLIPPEYRVFPVGRLDRNSEGLILMTNDGALADQLTHPRYGVMKVYQVTVAGQVTPEAMKKMREGIFIAEGRVRVEGARIRKARGKATEMEITLREGKNREIRRILARLGHKVQQLRRIAIGPLRLGELPVGAYRQLGFDEIKKLKAEAHAGTMRASGEGEEDVDGDSFAPPRPKTKKASKPKAARTRSGTSPSAAKSPRGKSPRAKTPAATKPRPAAGKPRKPGKQPPAARGELKMDLSASTSRTGSIIGAETEPEKQDKAKRTTKRTANKRTSRKTVGDKTRGRSTGKSAGQGRPAADRKRSPGKNRGR